MNTRFTLSAAATLVASVCQAQTVPNLAETFKNFDLVCSGVSSTGKLECEFRPKAGAAAAAPSPGPAPGVAALAAAPAPSLVAAPAAAPAAPPTKTVAKAAASARQEKASFADALQKLQEADLSVPDSPAFAVLGISPSEVQRPGTVRELASSLVRGFDESGKPKTGLAVDLAPLPLFYPQAITGGADYASKPVIQALTRTTMSFATTAAADGKASQFAWGLRMGVIDRGDPGLYYKELVECLARVKMPDIPAGRDVDPLPAPESEQLKQATAECAKNESQKGLWAKPALYVGLGRSWYSQSGRLTDTAPAVTSWWATYSQGIDRGSDNLRALLQLHASRRIDDRVEDPNDSMRLVRQDSTKYIGRLRAGRDAWHVFGDVGRRRAVLEGVTSERLRHLGLGAEFKLTFLGDDVWLQLGTVRESGYSDGITKSSVTTGLRFGSEPLFTTPP